MNPQPIPRPENTRNSIAHWAARASLILPVVFFLWGLVRAITAQISHTPYHGTALLGIIDVALIVVGFVAAIVGLAGIPAYGKPGLLAPGIAGLVINGLLILGIGFAGFYLQKAPASQPTINEPQAPTAEIRPNLKKPSSPKNSVTNADIEMIDKFSSQLKNTAQKLSGNDAKAANVMLAYLDQKRSVLKTFHDSVAELNDAQVLTQFDPNDKGQFTVRREIVQRVLNANSELIQITTNGENSLRAELAKAQVSEPYIQSFIAGFHLSTAPVNAITLQIRQCDDRMGHATLDALDTLESQWGHWKVDSTTRRVLFDNLEARETYNKAMTEIKNAADEEAKLQAELAQRPQR